MHWSPPQISDPADGDRATVVGYPTRVDVPWWLRPESDAPGPIAGLIDAGASGDSAGLSSWVTVSATGRLHALGVRDFGIDPALSASGTRLVTFDGPAEAVETGHPFLWDLVSGRRVVLENITSNALTESREGLFWTQQQTPSFWSPDEERVLITAVPWQSEETRTVIADWSGRLIPIRPEGEADSWAAGWIDDDHLAWFSWEKSQAAPTVVVTDLDGKRTDSVALRVPGFRRAWVDQWSAAVSPDGARVSLRTDGDDERLLTVDLATGEIVDEVPDPQSVPCGTTWWRGQAAGTANGSVLSVSPRQTLIRISTRWEVGCSVWAADALAGSPHQGVIGWIAGDRTLSLLWWWREIAIGMGVVGLGVGAIRKLQGWRRRRTLRP